MIETAGWEWCFLWPMRKVCSLCSCNFKQSTFFWKLAGKFKWSNGMELTLFHQNLIFFANGGHNLSLYSPIHLDFYLVQQDVHVGLISSKIYYMNWSPFFTPCKDARCRIRASSRMRMQLSWSWKEENLPCSWCGTYWLDSCNQPGGSEAPDCLLLH